MPTFEYICTVCEHEFSIEKSYNDTLKIRCPKCDSLRVRRKITSVPTIIYHGDGFTKSAQKLTDE